MYAVRKSALLALSLGLLVAVGCVQDIRVIQPVEQGTAQAPQQDAAVEARQVEPKETELKKFQKAQQAPKASE